MYLKLNIILLLMGYKSNLKIVVTGASGYIAKHIRKLLYNNKTQFTSISRNNFKCYNNEHKILSSSIDEALSNKIKNYDVLIHLIGIGKQTTELDYHEINTNLTKNVIALCKKARIKKIVYISGLGVSKKTTSCYFISKYKAEKLIIDSGLDYIIFRASYIIGNNDHLSTNIIKQIKQYDCIQIPGSGNYSMQPIYVDDAVKVILYSIQSKKFVNGIFDLVGPDIISFKKFIDVFKRKKKLKQKIKFIDLEKAYFNALHNSDYIYSTDDLNILVGSFVGDHRTIDKFCNIEFSTLSKALDCRVL